MASSAAVRSAIVSVRVCPPGARPNTAIVSTKYLNIEDIWAYRLQFCEANRLFRGPLLVGRAAQCGSDLPLSAVTTPYEGPCGTNESPAGRRLRIRSRRPLR